MKIAFFGTSEYSVMVLDALKQAGMTPALVIATPDKPKGRKLILTPPPTKVWAEEHNVPVVQPDKLKDQSFVEKIKQEEFDVFVVVAYGKIIPKVVLDLAKHGALNVHASLLPKLRGASPIETAILENEKETGVTIMLVDEEMDHGPIIAQEKVVVEPRPPHARILGEALVKKGAELLVKVIPDFIAGKVTPIPQDHSQATFTRKIEKEDGHINLTDDPYQNFLKIQAFATWPRTFFFIEKNGKQTRVTINSAKYNPETKTLEILTITPEGKKEMNYQDFVRSL